MKFDKTPDKKYRSLPFWSLNGKLEEGELKAQINALSEMGFGGAFIHSRTGLATEYMSDEWLRLARTCCETLSEKGMDAWLYDEDRWPSGTCGGYVTRNPRFRRSFISAHICEREEFDLARYGFEYIASFAVKLCGEQYTEHPEDVPKYAGMRLADYFPVTHFSSIPSGYLGMTFCVEAAQPSDFYNGYTYVDTMAKEPTELFLRLTHEKYYEYMGELFGGTVKGIFSDEPHRGAAFNGFGIANQNGYRMIPYTPKLFEEYAARFGEDLRVKLPELYFSGVSDNFSATSWRYYEVCETLFLRNFLRPVYDWCKKHNLVFTGHMIQENSLAAQNSMLGSAMRFYEYEEYPGIDNLGTNGTYYQAAIAASSVSKQLGKKFTLSELYGCTGWKTTFEEYKQIGDWQALCGINLRCLHLSWYTMKGESKRDYPASINKQANWYREFRAVEEYFARLGKTLTESKPLTDTLVISPVESVWGLTHMGGYHSCFCSRDPDCKRIDEAFSSLTERLLCAGVDFDYGDEEIMSRKASVGADEGGAYVRVGKMKYRRVVLPAMVTVRSSTLKLLEKFIADGGEVCALDRLPDHIDGVRSSIGLNINSYSENVLVSLLGSRARVRIESDGKFIRRFKKTNDGYICFAVNADRDSGHFARIEIDGEYNVEKFDLRTGETVGIASKSEDGKTVVEYDFALSEELMLHYTKKRVAKVVPHAFGEFTPLANEPVEYRLSHPNVLVLDRVKAYADGKFVCEDEVLRADDKLRDMYGLGRRTGVMVQPWYKEKYMRSYTRAVCSLRLEYQFEAETIPGTCELLCESYGSYKLYLNGHALTAAPEPSDIDACFSLITLDSSLFVKGVNVLTAECDFADSTDVENMYILGSFGVKEGLPSRIINLPEKLCFGDICKQGLPFYRGDVTYVLPMPDGKYELKVEDFYAVCLKAGGKVTAFAPFDVKVKAEGGVAELTATLTPKNMFGPLHELPALRYSCGPVNFRTRGDDWSDGYSLIPQGLFAPPKVRKIK